MTRKFTSTHAQCILLKQLANKKQPPFVPSVKKIRYWWDIINAAVFCNKIEKPLFGIKIRTTRGEWARVMYSTNDDSSYSNLTLFMSQKYRSFMHFITVLTHEMVHAWEFTTYGSSDHGDRFMSWKLDIQQLIGVELTEYIK